MPIDYDSIGGDKDPNEEYVPKVGQEKVITITSSQRVDKAGDANNFRSKEENFGFHYKLNLSTGKFMLLNIFALFRAFQESNVQDGDTIKIIHPARGVYEVKVKRNEDIKKNDRGDLDYLKEIEARHSVDQVKKEFSGDVTGWED